MKRGTIHRTFLAVAAGTLLPLCAAASDIQDLLQQAESVRSKDPKALASALGRLESIQGKATPAEQRQYQLLRAYQEAITGKYDTAIRAASHVYEKSNEPELKFRAALLIANGAAITRDFSLGLRYLERALGMADQIPSADLRHEAYLVAAVLYNQYGQYALGQHYAERLLVQTTSPRNRCVARHLRVEALYRLGGTMDDGDINSAIDECSAQREPIASNLLRGHLARHWVAQGQAKRAIELLESNLPEIEATRYPWLIGEIHSQLAQYHLDLGSIDTAKSHALSALEKGDKNAYLTPLVTAHKVLYEVALKRNDLATALSEYRQYAEADKARLDEVKAREFAFQLSRHELQQKNQSIELLQRQNDVLRLQQEVAKKSAMNNRLMTVMLLMLLGVGAYWAYKIKRVQVMFRRQAQVDSLTGIANRGHFREQAETQLARCKANGQAAALVLLDLDNFKRINDCYGHAAGDWALQQVAAACKEACREGDLFGRLGGEEFAILSCGGDLHAAERIAHHCREHLARIDTSSLGEDAPSITASFGCATTRLSGHGFETLFMHADRAMYRAKAEGRDRICAHEDKPVLVRTQSVTA